MREIKFRFWIPNEKRMTKPFDLSEITEAPRLQLKVLNTVCWSDSTSGHSYTWVEKNKTNVEPMQYTGLKDKNGKEIYEGDIMSVNSEIAEVYYDENNVCFCLETDIDYNPCIGRYEIIGNKFENPDLLQTNEPPIAQ